MSRAELLYGDPEFAEIEIDPGELNNASHELFVEKLYRRPAITFGHRKGERLVIINTGTPHEEVISESELRQEKLSELTVTAMVGFRKTEMFLRDYMDHAIQRTRYIRGSFENYLQWGREENGHDYGLELILETAGRRTRTQNDADYNLTTNFAWDPLYNGILPMYNFAGVQELVTRPNYVGIGNRTEKVDGAPKSAKILFAIGADEGYHGGTFLTWISFFAQLNPEAARKIAIKVARDPFYMPAIEALNRREKAIMKRVCGYNDQVVRDAKRQVLRVTPGISDDEIEAILGSSSQP